MSVCICESIEACHECFIFQFLYFYCMAFQNTSISRGPAPPTGHSHTQHIVLSIYRLLISFIVSRKIGTKPIKNQTERLNFALRFFFFMWVNMWLFHMVLDVEFHVNRVRGGQHGVSHLWCVTDAVFSSQMLFFPHLMLNFCCNTHFRKSH